MKILENIRTTELFWNIRPRGNCSEAPPELVEAPRSVTQEEEGDCDYIVYSWDEKGDLTVTYESDEGE